MAPARLSRLQRRILAWLVAEEQRTRGTMAASHQELVSALSADKGNISYNLRRLEDQHHRKGLRGSAGHHRCQAPVCQGALAFALGERQTSPKFSLHIWLAKLTLFRGTTPWPLLRYYACWS
jgi:hypothetical protein